MKTYTHTKIEGLSTRLNPHNTNLKTDDLSPRVCALFFIENGANFAFRIFQEFFSLCSNQNNYVYLKETQSVPNSLRNCFATLVIPNCLSFR